MNAIPIMLTPQQISTVCNALRNQQYRENEISIDTQCPASRVYEDLLLTVEHQKNRHDTSPKDDLASRVQREIAAVTATQEKFIDVDRTREYTQGQLLAYNTVLKWLNYED